MLAVWGSGVTPHSLLRAPGDLVSPSECTYIYIYICIYTCVDGTFRVHSTADFYLLLKFLVTFIHKHSYNISSTRNSYV